jgi:hypothetical protein
MVAAAQAAQMATARERRMARLMSSGTGVLPAPRNGRLSAMPA